METLSARSILSAEGSSPPWLAAGWGAPGGGPSGPVGPAGAGAGAAAGGAELFPSLACCRSWAEEAREGLGLGGAGEEEGEEDDSAGGAEPC